MTALILMLYNVHAVKIREFFFIQSHSQHKNYVFRCNSRMVHFNKRKKEGTDSYTALRYAKFAKPLLTVLAAG